VLHVGLTLETHARPGGSLPELLAALKFANLEGKKRDQIKKTKKTFFTPMPYLAYNQSVIIFCQPNSPLLSITPGLRPIF